MSCSGSEGGSLCLINSFNNEQAGSRLYSCQTLHYINLHCVIINHFLQIIVNGVFEHCIDLEALFQVTNQLPELPTFEQLNVKPDDPALIMFSSGTTGPQKAVLTTHRNLQALLIVVRCSPSCLLVQFFIRIHWSLPAVLSNSFSFCIFMKDIFKMSSVLPGLNTEANLLQMVIYVVLLQRLPKDFSDCLKKPLQ